MIKIYDRASMAHVLTLGLDPHLRALLERRFAALATPYGDLTDWTEFLVVQPGDAEEDVVREVGFSPLVDPDGVRFGSPAFQPFWDHLSNHGSWSEISISFGSTFAYILFVKNAGDFLSELHCLCRRYN